MLLPLHKIFYVLQIFIDAQSCNISNNLSVLLLSICVVWKHSKTHVNRLLNMYITFATCLCYMPQTMHGPCDVPECNHHTSLLYSILDIHTRALYKTTRDCGTWCRAAHASHNRGIIMDLCVPFLWAKENLPEKPRVRVRGPIFRISTTFADKHRNGGRRGLQGSALFPCMFLCQHPELTIKRMPAHDHTKTFA